MIIHKSIVHVLDKNSDSPILNKYKKKNSLEVDKFFQKIINRVSKDDDFEKKYITVVKGIIEEDEGTINQPIYRPTDDSVKRVVDERGQESITHYKVIERLNDATTVQVPDRRPRSLPPSTGVRGRPTGW